MNFDLERINQRIEDEFGIADINFHELNTHQDCIITYIEDGDFRTKLFLSSSSMVEPVEKWIDYDEESFFVTLKSIFNLWGVR